MPTTACGGGQTAQNPEKAATGDFHGAIGPELLSEGK
jgi:hypothetical protein